MPDRDNWTAPMLLKWVLTRDQGAALAMVDSVIGVFEDYTAIRLARADINAVMSYGLIIMRKRSNKGNTQETKCSGCKLNP